MEVIIGNSSDAAASDANRFPLFRAQCHWCHKSFRLVWQEYFLNVFLDRYIPKNYLLPVE
jgi:hypothetical protein